MIQSPCNHIETIRGARFATTGHGDYITWYALSNGDIPLPHATTETTRYGGTDRAGYIAQVGRPSETGHRVVIGILSNYGNWKSLSSRLRTGNGADVKMIHRTGDHIKQIGLTCLRSSCAGHCDPIVIPYLRDGNLLG